MSGELPGLVIQCCDQVHVRKQGRADAHRKIADLPERFRIQLAHFLKLCIQFGRNLW